MSKKKQSLNHVGLPHGTDPFGTKQAQEIKCECGHTAIYHHTQGQVAAGYWQCNEGSRADFPTGDVYVTKWLGCEWHQFVPAKGKVKNG